MRNRIIWKFFGAFIFLTLIVVLVLNFFVSIKLSDNFEQKITEKLQSNAILVGDILKTDLLEGQRQTIPQKIRVLSDKLNLRITVIDEQGNILADSEKDPRNLCRQIRDGDNKLQRFTFLANCKSS